MLSPWMSIEKLLTEIHDNGDGFITFDEFKPHFGVADFKKDAEKADKGRRRHSKGDYKENEVSACSTGYAGAGKAEKVKKRERILSTGKFTTDLSSGFAEQDKVYAASPMSPQSSKYAPPKGGSDEVFEDDCVSTPPSTPRLSRPVGCDRQTSPLTPRKVPIVIGSLLDALLRDDARQVRIVLDRDHEAANEPFVDHAWEPPLCAAIRLHVSEEIVELLLRYGASVHATDVHNKTPLEVLSSLIDPANNPLRMKCHVPLDVFPWKKSHEDPVKIQSLALKKWSVTVARHLTLAGADATSIKHGSIESALQMARQNGNLFLVEFLEGLNRKDGTSKFECCQQGSLAQC